MKAFSLNTELPGIPLKWMLKAKKFFNQVLIYEFYLPNKLEAIQRLQSKAPEESGAMETIHLCLA